MIKHAYTIDDARREVRESIEEGRCFTYIWIFLNDLVRGQDITKEERDILICEMAESDMEKSLNTF